MRNEYSNLIKRCSMLEKIVEELISQNNKLSKNNHFLQNQLLHEKDKTKTMIVTVI